jgi:hypothetical protein
LLGIECTLFDQKKSGEGRQKKETLQSGSK